MWLSRPCAALTNSSPRSATQRTGAAEPSRRPQHQYPFGIEEILHAKAAADIGRGQVDARLGQMEDGIRQLAADGVDALTGKQQVQGVGSGVVAADRGARLDRRRHHPVVDERDLDDMRGVGEGRLGRGFVAALETKAKIARRLVPDPRGSRRQRGGCLGNGIERAIVDRDEFGGVARLVAALGDDKGDRVADMPNPPARQGVARRYDQRVDGRDLGDAGQGADAVGGKIGYR